MRRQRTYAPSYRSRSTSRNPKKARVATYQRPVTSSSKTISAIKGIGNRVTSNFIYCDQFNIDGAAAGVTGKYTLSLSSLFDPNVTGAGHQPGGFDELMAIYEKYCVTEAEYRITIYNNNATAGSFNCCSISDVPTSDNDIRTIIENGQCQHHVLGLNPGGASVKTFSGTVDIAKAHGVSRSQLLSDDTFWGGATVSPPDQIFLKLATTGINFAADGPQCNVVAEIKYKAVLMGSQFVTQS